MTASTVRTVLPSFLLVILLAALPIFIAGCERGFVVRGDTGPGSVPEECLTMDYDIALCRF